MTQQLEFALEMLSQSQRMATDWGDGSMLVLAGPGVGKTTVLTTRIARILEESKQQHFRILALTFTTKAGDEMRQRVEELVPGMIDRTVIGTFHSFCARILRQHGSQLDIKPDFVIYDQDQDRAEVLSDALDADRSQAKQVEREGSKWLRTIDQLRAALIQPDEAEEHFRDASVARRVSYVYSIYDRALKQNNAMDFNGLVLNACRLVESKPAVAARLRRTYRFWMIDEFQDTTLAQYRFIRKLADGQFNNIFAVADDDQIIYEWAGASYERIQAFQRHYCPKVVQLVENRRCPPQVVDAANRLISHNSIRTNSKAQLVASLSGSGERDVHYRSFATDFDEASEIARVISEMPPEKLDNTAVLGRTRKILEPVVKTLRSEGVRCNLATRRDQFVSPQFVWLQNALHLSLRPTDRQAFRVFVGAGNKVTGLNVDAQLIDAEASSTGGSLLEYWALALSGTTEKGALLSDLAMRLVQSRADWRAVLEDALEQLPSTTETDEASVGDLEEDKAAWLAASKFIVKERGRRPELNEMLQGIALRPKGPPLEPNTLRLLTIHGAKGLEFDNVWVMGLADTILPSWQSLKSGVHGPQLEEERRNFFVAITRTRKKLMLSYAKKYGVWPKKPSQFLAELGLNDL